MPSAMLPWFTLALSANLLLLVAVLLIVKRYKFLQALKNIPAPAALPIIGNALQLNCSLEEFFNRLLRWSQEFGDMYLVWVGSRPFVFLYRVEAVQPLLSSSTHIDKSLEYQYLQPWLGTGLITSTGEKWHSRRKLLTPTFHSDLLRDYYQVATLQSETFVSCLKEHIGTAGFNIVPYAKRAALDVICQCAMGQSVNAQTRSFKNQYVSAVDELTQVAQKRFTNVFIKYDPIFKLTNLHRKQAKALDTIHSFVDQVIAQRKMEWDAKQSSKKIDSPRKPQTLLDLLFEMRHNGAILTDGDIREEVNTFMFAGHDTVGMSISWILYAFGRNPKYQDKVLEEFDEIVGSGELTYESLSKLVWLDACVKETWRLYPVTPLIARQIYSPITLQGNEIPSGSTVLVNSYLLHRDPRYFPDPEAYKPERFLPGSPKYPSFAYIPFSAGSRNCIGSKFATMEVKLMLLALLRAYSFHSVDTEAQLRLSPQVVLDNVGGITLSIIPRQQLH